MAPISRSGRQLSCDIHMGDVAKHAPDPRQTKSESACPASFEAFFFVSDLAMDAVASGRLPTSPPTPSPPASATNEPDNQQQYQRANGGVDNRRNNARAKMDAELRKQPTTDERAYNSNDEIADDPKPGALHDLAGQPSGNEADP
jgi:hypothetical protein